MARVSVEAQPDEVPMAWLRKRAEFLAVQRARKQARRTIVLQARDRRDDSALIRTGLTVSRKVGNAVERNRVRRRLRTVLNNVAPVKSRPGHDYVVVGRRNALNAAYDAIVADMNSAFEAIHKAPGKN